MSLGNSNAKYAAKNFTGWMFWGITPLKSIKVIK